MASRPALLSVLAWLAVLAGVPAFAQTFGASTVIWQQRSVYRNIIVLEGNGHRCLTFGKRSARQSCVETADPAKLVFGYTQKMFEALAPMAGARRVLVLGIGGGSLPMAIHRALPGVHVDAVELDPQVIEVAIRYFQFRPGPRLSVVSQDGRVFARQALRAGIRYDAILLDAFDKDYIPEHLATVEFLQQIRALLVDDGLVLANTYRGTRYQPHEESTYQAVFGRIYEARIPNGNRIIMAGPGARAAALRMPGTGAVPPSGAQPMTDRYSPANALLAR